MSDFDDCKEGYYAPLEKPNCPDRLPNPPCKSCSKCQRCRTAWCGKGTHRPNLVVAHTVCPKCIDQPVTPNSTCKDCGSRCREYNEEEDPCPGTCGFREVVFEGESTA